MARSRSLRCRLAVVDAVLAHSLRLGVTVKPTGGVARSLYNSLGKGYLKAPPLFGGVHALPRLPYGFDALEPHIDAQTVQIHYRKHHQAHIDSLNRALENYPDLQSKSAEDLCREIGSLPEKIRTVVRHASGGHWNHSRLWAWMTPSASGAPLGKTAHAINISFGSIAAFKEQFSRAAVGVFGSGWTWLVTDGTTLSVTTTPNQDNPLMEGTTPILGLDVWEHAYYLKHQNRRADYVKAWWNVVNWTEVNKAL